MTAASPALRAEPRPLTRGVYLVAAAVPAAGLVLQLVLIVSSGSDVSSSADAVAVPLATRLVRLISYFTIQSNIVVVVVASMIARHPDRDGPGWRVARLDSLLGIVITGIVFATLLAPVVHPDGAAAVANVLLHYVSPWLFLLAWIVLGPRPQISWRTLPAAFVWPVAWIGYTLVHGAVSRWYPYPFLDVDALGYPVALRNIVVILLVAVALAVVFRLLDRLPALRR